MTKRITKKRLREIQDEFLEVLEQTGFIDRMGFDVPVFDKDSPTVEQLREGLYREYAEKMMSHKPWGKALG